MESQRELWQKPKLIVLVRGRQAEDVLTFCKTDLAGAVAGPQMFIRQCRTVASFCVTRCQSQANKYS